MPLRLSPRSLRRAAAVLALASFILSAACAGVTTGSLSAAILAGARAEAARATPYIMNYEVLKYPGGDVTPGTGVCTDLVVRAFRHAGIDLQQEIHQDRRARPAAYPKIWDTNAIDRNIDHRRCPNLVAWLRRHARSLPIAITPDALPQWQPGDVVFYVHKGATHPWHVAIVSDRHDPATGLPLIIDSFPPQTSETHRLDDFAPIHSHFRLER